MFDNLVRLVGFVSKDAEVKTTKTQREFTVLSLATTASWKDKTAAAISAERNGTSSSLYGIWCEVKAAWDRLEAPHLMQQVGCAGPHVGGRDWILAFILFLCRKRAVRTVSDRLLLNGKYGIR